MKTSRSQKDPLLPDELIVPLIMLAIGLFAGLALNPLMELLDYFKK